MATGHALSMVINSCVKPSPNSKSRLACSFTEREGASSDEEQFRTTWPRNEHDQIPHRNRTNLSEHAEFDTHQRSNCMALPEPTDSLFQTLTRDVGHLTDEQFYEKLLELKKEHRQTLTSLESAYNNKHGYVQQTQSFDFRDDAANNVTGQSYNDLGEYLSNNVPIFNGNQTETLNQSTASRSTSALKKDNVRDMSAKPPSGRPRSAWSDKKRRPGHSLRASRTQDDWRDITWTSDSEHETSASEQNSTINSTASTSRSKAFQDSPVSTVENMWDNFSVDDYAPRSRSGSESRASLRSNRSVTSSMKSQEWSPKITIPKPFTMTTRDVTKEKTKSRACLELEQEQEEKRKAEEAECQKQFKANPAPATTYLPLYDELKDRQNEKTRLNQVSSQDLTKSMQKPFKFMQREEEKKRHRTRSLPLAKSTEKISKPKNNFKARPVPKSVHDPNVAERILEEEEYRKIRIRMRAEDMLRSSALPQNMQIKGKEYTDGHLRQKLQKSREKKAFLTKEHKFHPKVKGDVPDYDQLYRKFQSEVSKKKHTKEPTVVQPFNLRTARIPSKRELILEELQMEEERRKQDARCGLSLSKSGALRRSLSASSDSIPLKTTASSVLRKSATERSLKEKAEKERAITEKERKQRLKEKKLKSMISQKALANDRSETLADTYHNKMKQYRQSERSRQEEYEQELQEMMSRVESRPFLFERESQTNAQKKAERKYQQALQDAGIDEDFLVRKSRGAATSESVASSRKHSYGADDFESSDGGLPGGYSGMHSARSSVRSAAKSRSSARNPYSDDDDDDTISSIHTDVDED